MVEKRIHFVGRKDSFRGRLAVAYGVHLLPKGFVFTSSGIAAAHERVQAADPTARSLAKSAKCDGNFSKHKTQTTSSLLKRQDVVIFLSKDVYDEALKKFKFEARKCLLWDIDDVETAGLHRKTAKPAAAARVWQKLASRVQLFLYEVSTTGWCDVFDEHNTALGYKLPAKWVDGRKGLWRRYVHAVVTTATNRYVVERRTNSQIFSRSRLHISLDGDVAAGETPRQAVQRNVRTKFGATIRPEQAAFQNVKKFNREVVRQNGYAYYTKYSNRFVYTYHVALTLENPILLPDGDSSREILLLKKRALLRALRYPAPSMKRQLPYGRKHYAKAVKRAKIYRSHN